MRKAWPIRIGSPAASCNLMAPCNPGKQTEFNHLCIDYYIATTTTTTIAIISQRDGPFSEFRL